MMAKINPVGSRADAHLCDVLPMPVGFAVSYLDGALAGEHPEIKRMWSTVRNHLLMAASSPSQEGK